MFYRESPYYTDHSSSSVVFSGGAGQNRTVVVVGKCCQQKPSCGFRVSNHPHGPSRVLAAPPLRHSRVSSLTSLGRAFIAYYIMDSTCTVRCILECAKGLVHSTTRPHRLRSMNHHITVWTKNSWLVSVDE